MNTGPIPIITIVGNNDKIYTLPFPTDEEQNLLDAAKNPQEVYNVLKQMLRKINLKSTFEFGSLILTDADGKNICGPLLGL